MPDASTGLVVLLGDPVEHSLSPQIHNAAFQAQGLNLIYLACRVPPARLADAINGLDALGAVGANVTIPHKQGALALATSASPAAQATGAANTLVRTPDGWHVDNTDVEGFLDPLTPYADSLRDELAIVIGAGGAARAVAWACTERLGARVVVAARRQEQADALAMALGVEALTIDEAQVLQREAALVVNATPVGMAPHASSTPWSFPSGLRSSQIAYDLVYRPAKTRFLREAEVAGATCIGGLPMLIGQAAASYRQWTNCEMPLDVVREILTRQSDA
ncbi:MAG: shikimate dehydrogenase [Rubricoccaceae bacterium]